VRAEYLGFEPGAQENQARALFAARYGVQPGEVIRTGGGLLVGPIPGGDLVQPGALARTQGADLRTTRAPGFAQLGLFEESAPGEPLGAILTASEGKLPGASTSGACRAI